MRVTLQKSETDPEMYELTSQTKMPSGRNRVLLWAVLHNDFLAAEMTQAAKNGGPVDCELTLAGD